MSNYTVHRYSISITSKKLKCKETTIINLPSGAKILSVGLAKWRSNELQMWCLVDPGQPTTKSVEVLIMGTGGFVDKETVKRLEFQDTVVCDENCEVYHIFIVRKPFSMQKMKN